MKFGVIKRFKKDPKFYLSVLTFISIFALELAVLGWVIYRILW